MWEVFLYEEAKIAFFSLLENWWIEEMLDKKCKFLLCLSKIDEEAMCELQFTYFFFQFDPIFVFSDIENPLSSDFQGVWL